jgi:hypothetical protein
VTIGGLSAADMAELRTLDELFMPDQCSITRVSPGTVNADGSGEPGSSVTTTYACRIAPLGGSPVEQVFAARLQNVTGFLVTLSYDADVQETDVIVSGSQRFQVIGVLAPTSFMTSVRAVCRRIT